MKYKDLKDGDYFSTAGISLTNGCIGIKGQCHMSISSKWYKDQESGPWLEDVPFTEATPEQKQWLDTCIYANKYTPNAREGISCDYSVTFNIASLGTCSTPIITSAPADNTVGWGGDPLLQGYNVDNCNITMPTVWGPSTVNKDLEIGLLKGQILALQTQLAEAEKDRDAYELEGDRLYDLAGTSQEKQISLVKENRELKQRLEKKSILKRLFG